MIIIDTSVFIDLFRGKSTLQVKEYERIEKSSTPFVIPVVCAQELIQGAKDQKEYRLLRKYLITQELLYPTDPVTTHLEAARLYFDCRRAGITVSSSIDCFIAQLAVEHGALLLHNDRDYDAIARVMKIQFFYSK